jgi:uncharacterized protein YndB with AHSA1/START domain
MMSAAAFDSARDLQISRVMKVPREVVWRAWTDPARFEQWWVPAPAKCKVQSMELRPGGAFITRISEHGEEFAPHLNACFLAVDELRRIIFTDALAAGWRPAQQPFMTAIITLDDHPLGTHYAAHVMHRTWSDRDKHEELGFFDGWGTVIGQLANHVEDLL